MIFKHVTFFYFSYQVFEMQDAFYIHNTPLFRPATFQGLNSHMWPVAKVLDRADMDILAK